MCPVIYRLWSRNHEGAYAVSYDMDAATLEPIRHATPHVSQPKTRR